MILSQSVKVTWKSHGSLLFANWLNYYVYQLSPFDLSQIGHSALGSTRRVGLMPLTANEPTARLTAGPVGPGLFRMTMPMILGISSSLLAGLAEAYYLGLLGSEQLAALGFTFPVTAALMSITLGVSIGLSSVLGAGGRGWTQGPDPAHDDWRTYPRSRHYDSGHCLWVLRPSSLCSLPWAQTTTPCPWLRATCSFGTAH